MLAHKAGPWPLLDEAAGYRVLQVHSPALALVLTRSSWAVVPFSVTLLTSLRPACLCQCRLRLKILLGLWKKWQTRNSATLPSPPYLLFFLYYPVLPPLFLSPCTKNNITSDWFLAYHFGSTVMDSVNYIYITWKVSLKRLDSSTVL